MNDYPTITVPTMFSYEELEAFFDEAARTKIASDFDYRCFLCRAPVKLAEAHFIPIINGYRTFSSCSHSLYTRALNPYDAANGLYLCRSCFYLFITTDDVLRKVVLMPCMPLMVYALHAMHLAKDEASRSQTLDMILDDLEQEPTLTEERRRAAPFLHCYQLHPLQPRSEESDTDSTGLLVWSSPTTYLDDVEGTQTTRYCIVEHHNRPGSVQAPSRRVPFYDQGAQGPVTLWRIPMRSPGSFFGNAATAMVDKRAYPRLYEVFENLKFTLKYERGLPRGFVPEGGRKSWADYESEKIGSSNLSPASIDYAISMPIQLNSVSQPIAIPVPVLERLLLGTLSREGPMNGLLFCATCHLGRLTGQPASLVLLPCRAIMRYITAMLRDRRFAHLTIEQIMTNLERGEIHPDPLAREAALPFVHLCELYTTMSVAQAERLLTPHYPPKVTLQGSLWQDLPPGPTQPGISAYRIFDPSQLNRASNPVLHYGPFIPLPSDDEPVIHLWRTDRPVGSLLALAIHQGLDEVEDSSYSDDQQDLLVHFKSLLYAADPQNRLRVSTSA